MEAIEADRRLARVRGVVRHGDPAQLLFQLREIAVEECYNRHGVSLQPGCVVLDVGANFGVAAAFFATECAASAVYSFEPAPATFDCLRLNLGDIPSCHLFQLGIGAARGFAELSYYDGDAAMSSFHADPSRDRNLIRIAMENMGASASEVDDRLAGRFVPEPIVCEMTTVSDVIDAHGIERIDLLKIYIERAEIEALAGIRDEHWSLIQQLVLETHETQHHQAARAVLQGQGFTTQSVQDSALRGTPVEMLYATRG